MHIVLIVEKGNLLCNFMYVLDVIGGGVHTLCCPTLKATIMMIQKRVGY
jgi:hypothetical protein